MTVTAKSLGIDKLDLSDRLALVEEIWASVCADTEQVPLSQSQRTELNQRVADDDRFPDDVASWDDIKTSVRVRLGRWPSALSFDGQQEPSSRMQQSGTRVIASDSAKNLQARSTRHSQK